MCFFVPGALDGNGLNPMGQDNKRVHSCVPATALDRVFSVQDEGKTMLNVEHEERNSNELFDSISLKVTLLPMIFVITC